MKNILKYILSFAFCVGVIFATTITVNAEESTSDTVMCDSAFEVGDTYSFYVKKTSSDNWEYEYILDYEITNDDERYCCMYLTTDNYIYMLNTPMGTLKSYPPGSQTPQVSDEWFGNNNWVPFGYANCESYIVSSSGFSTNIPIFSSQADAESYVNGDFDLIKSAINYKKTYENGSWVKPFEDIEINDSDILVPDLSNLSHEGFTVTNCNNDKYLIEIYMKSGFASPESGLSSVTTIDDALFVNNFGLITDNSEAYWNGPTINIAQLYGIDNISALTNSYTNFYTSYPSAKSYGIDASRDDTYIIWGNPFDKNTWFYTNNTEVDDSDLIGKSPYDFDLCFTNYRVRYFYYDDDSGYHYGPWCDVVYFSSGYITQSAIFQSNVGNIIETPITSGTQDSSGNINFNTSNIVDLNNPNELFGYLRSTINNINATGNTFMTLFATLFSFIPIELQIALWLGIACMIFIGVIKRI